MADWLLSVVERLTASVCSVERTSSGPAPLCGRIGQLDGSCVRKGVGAPRPRRPGAADAENLRPMAPCEVSGRSEAILSRPLAGCHRAIFIDTNMWRWRRLSRQCILEET